MDYNKLILNTVNRKSIKNGDWKSINNGKNIAIIEGVFKQLKYLGLDIEIVALRNFTRMPMLKIEDKYYGIYGEIDEEIFRDLGIESISENQDKLIKIETLELQTIAKWMGLSKENYIQSVVDIQHQFQLEIGNYVRTENPLKFTINGIEDKLYQLQNNGFDISRMMFHETRKENKEPIIKNGFDLNKIEAAEYDFEMPVGVFVKPDDISIGLYTEETCQIPFFIKKGNFIEIESREAIYEKLSKISPKWKEIAEAINSKGDEYEKMYDEKMKKVGKIDEKMMQDRSLYENKDSKENQDRSKLLSEMKVIIKDWKEMREGLSPIAKKEMNKSLKENKIEGIWLKQDKGGKGIVADTTVILNTEDIICADLNNFEIQEELSFAM